MSKKIKEKRMMHAATYTTQAAKGEVEVAAGKASGDVDLVARDVGQTEGNTKQASEKFKDAFE
jgi:uncharacterized protein YjbJ (UPF0337 family)